MANPRMTAEIGRVLGGRYRLVAPIGMGASAQVYLADDVRLRRRVAVKMLHDALADDAEFLRRFRAEARAAAALSHPNVMAVFDWGDDEVAFIVTEYLSGGSLRALLDTGSTLTPSQALLVGLEAARGLDYAHRRGFVHRDIKPANLLFGEEQRLRIADFGLARALAEAAWTEPQGAMLGTARYASPEQAKGEKLNGKADVYALALVLVEAVTGEVPFTADTTLGTLMARVDRQLEVPEALGPLRAVLARAGDPDPETRIDARTLAAGLLRAAKELPTPTALPLAGAITAAALSTADVDPTIHAAGPTDAGADLTDDDLELGPPDWVNQADAGAAAAATGTAIIAGDRSASTVEDPDTREPVIVMGGAAAARAGGDRSTGPIPVVASDGAGGGADGIDGDDGEGGGPTSARTGRRRWPVVLLVLALLLGAGGAAVALANRDSSPPGPPVRLPVPQLVGRTETQARAVAEAAGWKVTTEKVRKDGTTKGEVLATDPEAGTRLSSGGTLKLTVSAGQTIAKVPTDLAGKSLADATAELKAAGFSTAVSSRRNDEEFAKDVVIGVAGGTGAEREKGSTINLVVSDGPKPRTVPSGLVGSTEAEARAALEAVQLKMARVGSYSDSVAKGTVISVLPTSGSTVPRDSSVNVEVSLGPKLVAVPDISGSSSIASAIARIRSAGLVAGSVSGPATGSPIGTSPSAGTLVRPGSTVNIILG